MAKEIKAIKCPNCGSVSKIEIKPDYFKCNSCQTEYFLDNNDVNINYNHNFKSAPTQQTIKIIAIIIGSVLALIFLITIITSIFGSNKSASNSTYSNSTPTPVEKEKIDNGYSASKYKMLPFLQNEKPLILALESRRYNSSTNKSKEGTYIATYDPLKKILVSEEKVSDESHFSAIEFRTYSNGEIYIINDKATLSKLNKETLKTEDVGKKLFADNKELEIGVATMEFVQESYGDGLLLLTNDGKNRYYYPFIQKLYTEKEFHQATRGFDNLLPKSTEKVFHEFTSDSYDYPQEKTQLIAIKYRDNGVGPKDMKINLFWSKDYGRSGIFNGSELHTKSLINAYQKEGARILSWRDVTPDRLYFSPSVKLDIANNLIIQFQANANKKSNFKFQKLNPQSGAVEWTANLKDGGSLETMLKYKNGYIGVSRDDYFVVIDEKGIITNEYKLD